MSLSTCQSQRASDKSVSAAETSQELSIRRIGWAACLITTEAGTKVLLDPYLGVSKGADAATLLSGLPNSPFTVADLANVDLILVTHAGIDHRAQAIDVALAGSAILLSGPALYEVARKAGVPSKRLAEVASGVSFRHADVTVKALDARHNSRIYWDGQFFSDQPLSFMLTTNAGNRIFCGGDFSISADMKTWRELFSPRVGILGIGGLQQGPVENTALLPPQDAAIAAQWLGVSHVIPVHYPPGDTAPEDLRRELAALGSRVQVVTLEFGEAWIQKAIA